VAYIDWWNRTGPVTLGERFGLNEISTARNTLSPTKSHTAGLSESFPGTFTSYNDAVSEGFQGTREEWLQQQSIPITERPLTGAEGGRIGFDKGGGVKILEYLESLDIAEGTQINIEDVMKYAKDNEIKIGQDSISVNINSTDRKIGGAGPYKDNYVLKDDMRSRWNAIKHKVKVKHKIFDVKNPEPVFEQLDILLADKTKYPTQKSILSELGYSRSSSSSMLTPVLEAYAKDRNITIPADRFPIGSYEGTQIAADIISNYKTGKFTIADLARNYFPNKAHNDAKIQVNDILRDAEVRDPSEFRNWPGDKPEKWKKVRKERVKKLVERVGVDTAAQTLSLEKQIRAKNADILKMTDDEIWNNKKIQKSMNLDVKDLTKKNGTLRFDRYTEFLADGKKNPNYLPKKEFVAKVKAMAAPNIRTFWQPEHMAGIATEKLHAMFPNEVQAASGKIGGQMDALRAYLKANPNGKAVPEIEKLLNEFNMQIKSGGKTYGFKEKIIFNSKTGTSNIVEAGTKIFDKGVKTLSETTIGSYDFKEMAQTVGEKVLSVTQLKEFGDIIKALPYDEKLRIATAVGCKTKTPAKKSEGGRIGFGAGSVGMLACVDAKWEKNPKEFWKRTTNIASAGLDKLWKYAAPYWFPAVIVATGRLESFKEPTKPEMWWDILLASDAVKRLGLDKVQLSQLKNASLIKKADILGKLALSGGAWGDKILTKAAKVAKPLLVLTESLSAVKGIKSELDLVKEYALKNNIPYEKAKLAYYASGAALKPRWEGDKSFKSWAFSFICAFIFKAQSTGPVP